ncbi:MAG TPA: EamA family transporter [Streptosporangiaceae bacterium]|nr:EamA family transporter [Streptosporangiaceae bacterium]
MGAVLLALASAVGYGGSDFWAGLAARRASIIRVTVLAEATALAVLAVILPFAGAHHPSLASLAWGAAGGIGGAGGALALYLGFRNAAFSVAAPVSAVGAAGFSVLAGLLLGEQPGALALTGIALALPAIVGVSVSQGGGGEGDGDGAGESGGDERGGHERGGHESGGHVGGAGESGAGHGVGRARPAAAGAHMQGVLWGLLAGAGFGVLFIGLNRAGSAGGLWPVAAAQVAALAAVSGIGAVTGDLHLPAPGARRLAVLTGVGGGAGTILYFLATQVGLLAVTAVLTSLYPAVTIVAARLFLGERLTVIRLAGLGLAAASVGLIAASGTG